MVVKESQRFGRNDIQYKKQMKTKKINPSCSFSWQKWIVEHQRKADQRLQHRLKHKKVR